MDEGNSMMQVGEADLTGVADPMRLLGSAGEKYFWVRRSYVDAHAWQYERVAAAREYQEQRLRAEREDFVETTPEEAQTHRWWRGGLIAAAAIASLWALYFVMGARP